MGGWLATTLAGCEKKMSAIETKVHDDGSVEIKVDAHIFNHEQAKPFIKAYAGRAPETRFIVNMRHIDFIESSGFGILIGLYNHVKEKGPKVRLTHFNESIAQGLEMTKFNTLFDLGEET